MPNPDSPVYVRLSRDVEDIGEFEVSFGDLYSLAATWMIGPVVCEEIETDGQDQQTQA